MQKHEVVNRILAEYGNRAPIHKRGLLKLYETAESRDYAPYLIYMGLKTLILKNYIRKEYVPPNNDPTQEVIHERIYMQDWEFREIFS